MTPATPVDRIREERRRPGRRAAAARAGASLRIAAFLALLAAPAPARALEGRVDGMVLDGTMGGPGPADLVRLLSLKEGMNEVASLEDVRGRFQFLAVAGDPGDPFLLQANRAGVNYSRPFSFDSSGVNSVEVVAYDTTSSWKDVRVLRFQLGLAAETELLRVFKVIEVASESRPPKTVVGTPGAFLFFTQPDLIEIHTVSAQSGALPLTLSAIAVEGGKHAIPYALRPGTTEFQIAYDVGYDAAGTTFSDPLLYHAGEVNALVVPEGLTVTSEILSDQGADPQNKLRIFTGRDLPAGAQIILRLSGEGSPPTTASRGSGRGAEEDGSAATGDAGEEKVVRVPNRTSRAAPAIIAGVIVSLLGAVGWALSRGQGGPTGARAAADPEFLAQREAILDRIVALDRKHRAGELSEYAYWEKREALKGELADILERAGRGGEARA